MYEWLKEKYTGLKTAWDHCNIACEAEIAAKNQTIENLAKKFFSEYDSERYHYYEENEWREDFTETPEEGEYNERCENAYRDAADYINTYYSEFKIAERHTEIKKQIGAEIRMTMQVWQKLLTEDLMNMKKQKSLLDLAESLI